MYIHSDNRVIVINVGDIHIDHGVILVMYLDQFNAC